MICFRCQEQITAEVHNEEQERQGLILKFSATWGSFYSLIARNTSGSAAKGCSPRFRHKMCQNLNFSPLGKLTVESINPPLVQETCFKNPSATSQTQHSVQQTRGSQPLLSLKTTIPVPNTTRTLKSQNGQKCMFPQPPLFTKGSAAVSEAGDNRLPARDQAAPGNRISSPLAGQAHRTTRRSASPRSIGSICAQTPSPAGGTQPEPGGLFSRLTDAVQGPGGPQPRRAGAETH